MPLGFDAKELAKQQSDNSLAAINRRAEARRAAQRRAARQPQRTEPRRALTSDDIAAYNAEMDASGFGAAQVRSANPNMRDEHTPNIWRPVSRGLNAIPNMLLSRDPRESAAANRQIEDNLRAVGEGIVGPEEMIGAANRIDSGEGGGWDYANLALTALPFDGLMRPAGRRIANSRFGRRMAENVISPTDEIAAAARPRYEVRPEGNTLSVRREGLRPQTTPMSGDISDLRAVIADPQRNPALRLADEEAVAQSGRPFSVANVPQASLRRQGGIARMFEAATEGDDAYKSALFEQYGLQMPQVIEQSGAQNYDQLTEAAYRQLGADVTQQFDRLPVGMRYHDGELEYPQPSAMFRDALGNGNLNVFRGGDPHPYLSDIDPATGLTSNEQFRAVHDYLGHASTGSTFRPGGEEVAYAAHAQTLSPLARMALLSETRGQNSWVNYGTANAPLIGEMNAIRRQLADAGGSEADALRSRLRELGGEFQYAAQEPVLLPPEYLDIGAEGGVPDWGRSLIVPRSPLSVRGEHYSRVGDLTQTDPSFYGTGHIGSERQMVRREGLPDRTYFYSQGADGTPIYAEDPVSQRAPYRYEAELNGLYDVNTDPEGVVALANAYNQEGTALPDIERLIRDYGYNGYVSDFAPSWAPQSRRAAAMFNPVPVRRLP